jgi:biotin carboxyl carrier protein
MELRKKFIMRLNEADTTAVLVRDGAGRVWVEVEDGERVEDALVLDGGRTVSIRHRGRMFLVDLTPPNVPEHRALVNGRGGLLQLFDELGAAAAAARGSSTASTRELRADMPGLVVEVRCSVGDVLSPGMTVIVLEAMKMQNELASPGRVRVEEIRVEPGQSVESGALLVRFAEVEV